MSTAPQSIPEREATIPGALNLGRPALIGTFGAPDARRALVRSGRGRITRVEVGDKLLGGRVVRIGTGAVVIETGKGLAQLSLPDPG